jgi:hypothetical protein
MKNTIVAAVGGAVLALTAMQANATIINISATTGAFIPDGLLTPGKYQISFIGTADGGAYDAAYAQNCPPAGCTSGWSNAFGVIDPGPVPGDEVVLYAFGPKFGSALESLAAIQSAPFISHGGVLFGIPNSFSLDDPIPQPWIENIEGGDTFLFIPDADGNPDNNFGGVSLRFSAVVPEPSTWAMMIMGLGAAGAMLRRRRASAATA